MVMGVSGVSGEVSVVRGVSGVSGEGCLRGQW